MTPFRFQEQSEVFSLVPDVGGKKNIRNGCNITCCDSNFLFIHFFLTL